jgi:hypothetical protein
MKIKIMFPTGNWYEDGEPEIGNTWEFDVDTKVDLDDIIYDIPDGVDYFFADEDGNKVYECDVYRLLD